MDVAKLKAEFLQSVLCTPRVRLGHLLMKHIHRVSPLASRFAGLSNWFAWRSWVRGVMEGLAGIDRRRSLPEWHSEHLRKWFGNRASGGVSPLMQASHNTILHPSGAYAPARQVVLLDDCFTTFQEPKIGRAAVTLLERRALPWNWRASAVGVRCFPKASSPMHGSWPTMASPNWTRYASAGVPILGLEPELHSGVERRVAGVGA